MIKFGLFIFVIHILVSDLAYAQYREVSGRIQLDQKCDKLFPFHKFEVLIVEIRAIAHPYRSVRKLDAKGFFEFTANIYSNYKLTLLELREEQKFIQTTAIYEYKYPSEIAAFNVPCSDFVSDYAVSF